MSYPAAAMAIANDLFLKMVLQFAFHPDPKKPDRPVEWYRKREHVHAMVDAIARVPLFRELKVAGPDDELEPFATVDAAKKLMATGKDDQRLMQDQPERGYSVMVQVTPSEGSLELQVWCGRAALERHHATILDQMIAIAIDVRTHLQKIAGLQLGYIYPVHASTGRFPYPRPRPPRKHPSIQVSSIVDLIDLTFHRSDHEDAAGEGAAQLAASALPSFAKRSEKDGLVVIRWVDDAGDDEQLRRGASAHEVWIAEHLPTRVDGPYNELGDVAEKGQTAKPPLTLYSPSTKTGYKAVVVFPDGKVEESAWNEARSVMKAGKLPDGSPVSSVKIVVPLRALTFAIRERARKEGFAAVLYPSDDGYFWDPDPPGSWIGPPVIDPAGASKPAKK